MKYIAYCLAAILGVSLLSTPSQAQTTGGIVIEIPDINNYVGGAIGVGPDYFGSDDYTFVAAPVARFQIGKGERFAKLSITELSVNVLDNEQWSFGPLANYRPGRDDVDDDKVDDLSDIEGTLELGVFGGWTWKSKNDPRARLNLSLSAKQDVLDEHDGYLIDASARYFTPLSRSFVLSFGGAFTYGSSDYMDTYFGVSPNDSARSGLPRFEADGGARDVRFSVMGIQSLSANWHVGGGLVYSRLLSDAKDSPIVDDQGDANQFFLGVGAVYAW